ncbi:MAG: M56 family metallopeptidase, partial [Bacteroidales bacterium]
MLYLFETGICLSLLYLAYWLFLRKETYFNFNRLYLVGSIILALTVPVFHLSFMIPAGSSILEPASGLVKIRSYYEELIFISNADFGREPGNNYFGQEQNVFREGGNSGNIYHENEFGITPGSLVEEENNQKPETGKGIISAAGLFFIIYITGVIYFLIRFLYLVTRLYLLAKRNGFTYQEGFRMVEIKEDISPFSFFRFLFINHEFFNEEELANVLEHEKAHIRQRHSYDHLLVHGMTIFQWFNPFAWQFRNALKTTHEYIADHQVINKGYERFDYQSLLLRQVIGYHSVELVNNFNLKPVKKRIIMMNKNRSGIPAKFKALLVIPFAITVFFLFTDFTVIDPDNRIIDVSILLKEKQASKDLPGLWIKESEDNFADMLHFTPDRFSYSEGNEVRTYYWRLNEGNLGLSMDRNVPATDIEYELDGDVLTIWWNDSQSSLYRKSRLENTLDLFLKNQDSEIDLPVISQFRIMEDEKFISRVYIGYDPSGNVSISLEGKKIELEDLGDRVTQIRHTKGTRLDMNKHTMMLYIDKEIPMKEVDKVRMEFRKASSLKIAEAGYPDQDSYEVSELMYHKVALPRLLPPLDAKILEKEDLFFKGIQVLSIELSANKSNTSDLALSIHDFIEKNADGKYVLSLEYGEDIPYGEYLEAVDLVYRVVYDFRDELAKEKYQLPYDQLAESLQKEVRQAYPMMLS